MISRTDLTALATATPERPVLSVYARTDPRDPANTASTPAWRIELGNALRAVADRIEAGDDRELRLRSRLVRAGVEERLDALEPHERGRSIALFLDEDGETLARHALQLPVRATAVVWDARPYVSPLVDVVDRGAATGVVLVGREHVRLLHLEQGEASEPEDAAFELELGDWRPYGGSASGSSARGVQTTSHQERYDARVGEHRDRLYADAAQAVARRLDDLGWERVALLAERGVAARFREALPPALAERLVVDADVNLDREDDAEIAAALEPRLEEAWLAGAVGVVDRAREEALAGGRASLGVEETLGALVAGRVAHLVLDPGHAFPSSARVPAAIGGPPELLGERAVEAAVATGAEVTALAVAQSAALGDAGGMAALLRY